MLRISGSELLVHLLVYSHRSFNTQLQILLYIFYFDEHQFQYTDHITALGQADSPKVTQYCLPGHAVSTPYQRLA